MVVLLWCSTGQAQQPRRGANPFAGDAAALAKGEKLYGVRCAICHGKDGRGGEAPSLHKSRIVVLSPDRRFFDVVKFGIPGTEMPPLPGPDDAAWQVVAYVHSIAKPGAGPPVPGDADAGRRIFERAGCHRCHFADGKGGVIGPDLSSIAVQSSSAAIRESIVEPAAKVMQGFRLVKLRFPDGTAVTGILKNEDNFSVQVMTDKSELRAFDRSKLAGVDAVPGSAMPAGLTSQFSPEEFQNLLAYLDRQRAPVMRRQIGFQNY